MVQTPVYMDNHATTRVDPRVVEAMLPLFHEQYGNAGSTSHAFGWDAKEVVDQARESIALAIGATSREIVFTSGATESNNLAIRGSADRTRRRGNHIVSVATEHKAVLDPLSQLARRGFEVTLLPVRQTGDSQAGVLDVQRVADAIRDDTLLVSVMLANNEIGVIQPLAEIGTICKQRGVLLHSDATQAVGKIPVDVEQLQVDLLSFSAHKLYGPKGVGGLYVRRRAPQVRLTSQIDGGGQEGGRRSGTLNVPGIVGFATAVMLCLEEMEAESVRLADLRGRLFDGLANAIDHVTLNGPALDNKGLRLAGNLSCSFADVDGEALMMSMRDLCVSSGSACTSANPEPSHVLRALGLSDDLTRASLRFGIGRFNTQEEVDFAVTLLTEAVQRLRGMSSLK
ncbi:MAG: aminotransferase class V-fold PLP-dependent enzyme [Planctomycetota bacterium]|nr:aminotransferase class V-fold PLP-dependent enzyme [Planctomycetota bacterium]